MLVDDTIVLEWMIAKGKISLARILGAFNYNLLGNITINFEQWRTEGEAELDRLREKIWMLRKDIKNEKN